MTEEDKQKTQRTIAELTGRRATVSEEAPLSISPRRQNAIVDEAPRRVEINERQLLLPDEQAELDKQKGKNGKQVSKAKKDDADRKRPGFDNQKLFEEGDIIDWMFKNILVAGMDWLGNKAVNATAYLAGFVAGKSIDYCASRSEKIGKWCKNKYDKWNPLNGEFGKYPDDNTTNFQKTIADFHAKEMKDCDAYGSEENFHALLNGMRLISEGRVDEFNTMMNGRMSAETMEKIRALSPEERQAMFSQQNAMDFTEKAIETSMAVKHYSANMAYIRIMNEKMEDKDKPKRDSATLFAEYQEEARVDMLAYMDVAAKSGKDPFKARDELLGLSIVAGKNVDEEIADRHYNEQGGKPARNTALERIEVLTAVTKEPQYRTYNKINDFVDDIIKVSNEQQQALTPVQQEENNQISRWEGNARRRQDFHERVNRIRSNQTNANQNNILYRQTANQR